jgi:hypothetical protein
MVKATLAYCTLGTYREKEGVIFAQKTCELVVKDTTSAKYKANHAISV